LIIVATALVSFALTDAPPHAIHGNRWLELGMSVGILVMGFAVRAARNQRRRTK
jgi:hypothetical protein